MGLFFTPVGVWGANVRMSVVKIETTVQDPNYKMPWNPGSVSQGRGSGFILKGNRILTNAHVVSDARFITVERDGDPNKYPARVIHVAHDCDLAIVKPNDEAFFKGMEPLSLGDVPVIESTVSVYGYPIGGQRLSVTRGIVSRIDFQVYSHSSVDSHLAVQIDAAINPGNSGGPVLQEDKVVGVAFQGYSGDVAQNVGYMIPVPVIGRFLEDVSDGKYDHYVELGMTYFPLVNPSYRKALGLPDDGKGIVVTQVLECGSCRDLLKKGDVIVGVDDHEIASDGSVKLNGEHLEMNEIVERKFRGDAVKLQLIRDRKPLEVTVHPDWLWPAQMLANAYDRKPRFVLFSGLLFQPLSRDYIRSYGVQDLRISHLYDNFVDGELYRDRPEPVILSDVLPDPINTRLIGFAGSIVDKINGRKIENLKAAAEELAKKPDFYVIELEGQGRPIVIERNAAAAARVRIQRRYQVFEEQNLDSEPHRPAKEGT